MGKDAIYHQHFAGNCIEQPNVNCFSDGLGPQRFDCSGLVLRSLSDVIGKTVNKDAPRHVRDMWQQTDDESAYRKVKLAVGTLAIMRRRYMINDAQIDIPGHIGVVSGIEDGISIIHANSRSGKVEESTLRDQSRVMGYIVPNLT